MEGTNQPATRPPAPTVEDEFPTEDQANTASTAQRNMSNLPNGPSASADNADTHDTESGTPTNNGPAANADQPRTPANAAPDAPAADRVQIVLKDQSGMQVAFGVKSNTRMEKVQNAYADRAGRPVGSLRFYYEGARVLPEDTVASLEMENEDIIEVMTEQIGGSGQVDDASIKLNRYVAKYFPEDDVVGEIPFSVNAVEVEGKMIREMEFVVGPDVKVKDFMHSWAKRAGCAVDKVVFRYNSDKEGPGLPFESEDDTFGDDFMYGDTVCVSAAADEPVNLARPSQNISADHVSTQTETPKDMIQITVKYFDQADVSREMHCKMTPDMSFNKFIDLYAKRRDIDASAQRLTFNGNTVFLSDTPASIGAETGAVLNIAEDTNVFALDLTLE